MTIAIDLDDVIAVNVPAFIAFSNEHWGTALTIEDYDEHWTAMWNIEHEEAKRRSHEFHASGTVSKYAFDETAKPALQKLKQQHKLVIITSRQRLIQKETLVWLDTYFKGIFDEVHFAGMWDAAHPEAYKATKAEIARQVGAEYLVDDQPKHCLAVAEAGITALLFGDYPWNRSIGSLPERVTRVRDWQAVVGYFDERS